VRRFFEEEFPDAVPLMPTLLEDFKSNPTGSLVTVRCSHGITATRFACWGMPLTLLFRFMAKG
jgi:hypothetical protein